MRMSELTSLERERVGTCLHEAGHAVAAVLSGGVIDRAEVYAAPVDGMHGRTFFNRGDLHRDTVRAITYAGAYAEVRWSHGNRFPRLSAIRETLRGSCDQAALDELGGGLAREVEPILDGAWTSVRHLAGELYSSGRIDHADVLAALGVPADDDGTRLAVVVSMLKAGQSPTPIHAESR